MIRKISLLFAIVTLGSLLATAQQSASKFDLFGGYSYFNGSTSGTDGRYSLNGWNGQGTYNFTRWLGATADFGGYYGSPFSLSAHDTSFLFGPTISMRTAHFTPYVHALVRCRQCQALPCWEARYRIRLSQALLAAGLIFR